MILHMRARARFCGIGFFNRSWRDEMSSFSKHSVNSASNAAIPGFVILSIRKSADSKDFRRKILT